jgi:hypothetical protein
LNTPSDTWLGRIRSRTAPRARPPSSSLCPATERLQDEFLAAMAMTRDDEDRSNVLLDVWTQVSWLGELGFEDADCHWKWRELALIGGVKPVSA